MFKKKLHVQRSGNFPLHGKKRGGRRSNQQNSQDLDILKIPDRSPEDPRGQADLDILNFINCAKPLNSAHLESVFYYFSKMIFIYLVAKQPNRSTFFVFEVFVIFLSFFEFFPCAVTRLECFFKKTKNAPTGQ